MKDINKIHGFPEYRHIDINDVHASTPDNNSMDLREEDEVLGYIFAPDPVTGNPRSDLALLLTKDNAPEIREYISKTLAKVQPDSLSTDDPDLAISTVKSRRETLEEYGNRLREFVHKEYKKSVKDEK